MNILMLYPKFSEATFWDAKAAHAKIFNRKAQMAPLGLLTLASYLPDDFQVRLIDRNVTEESDADWEWADVVLLSLMVVQQFDYRTCVTKAKQLGKPIAVGGPFTHAMPEVATADADWVCFGEAEDIMDEFIEDLRAMRRGIHYQGGNKTNMEQVRIPRYELLPDVNAYVMMPVQFSRGCPFQCEFCDIIEIYGRIPRAKKPDQVLAELDQLKQLGYVGSIFLVDDNFIGNKRKAKLMLDQLAIWTRHNGDYFYFMTEASLNMADEEELMKKMHEANFIWVFIGIETPDPKLLKTTKKMQNIPGDPLEKLRRIREHGIHITAGFIVGFDGEKRDVFEVQKHFIQQSGIGIAMIAMLEAIPHTELARRLKSEGRLLDKVPITGCVIESDGINFIPKGEMTKREYLERYIRLLKEIYAPEAFFNRIRSPLLSLRRKIRVRGAIALCGLRYPLIIRLCYHIGLKGKGMRFHFWKTLLSVMWRNPGASAAFLLDCYYFYHIYRHVDYVAQQLTSYLANPLPNDVLDVVIPADELPAVAANELASPAHATSDMVAL